MAKRQVAPLSGRRIRLRLLSEADLPLTLAWRNQDHIRKWFVHSEIIPWEQHQRWCAQYFQRDTDFIFIIEETRDLCRPVGQVSLYNIDWGRKRAEYGRLMIGDGEAAGKGLAKEATEVLLAYAFACLNFEEVALEVFKDNVRARALYASLGFITTGERDDVCYMAARRR